MDDIPELSLAMRCYNIDANIFKKIFVKNKLREFKGIYMPMFSSYDEDDVNVWNKVGDYGNKGAGAFREVKYQSNNSDCIIKEIMLYSEHANELHVKLKFKEQYDIAKFQNHMIANEYPKTDYVFFTLGNYDIPIPNAEYLSAFLREAGSIIPAIHLIADEIIESVADYMHEEPTLTGWARKNSLSVNGSVTYLSCARDSKFKELLLTCNNLTGKISLYAKIKDEAYNEVNNALTAYGYVSSDRMMANALHVNIYPIESVNDLEKILLALISIEKNVDAISESMIKSYYKKTKPEGSEYIGLFKSKPKEEPQYNILGELIHSPQP